MLRRLLAIVVLTVTAACGSDGSPGSSATPGVTSSTEPRPSVAATSIEIEISGGEVVGGVERHEVPLGDQVRLSVRSDVADEVHVHGYDESAEVPADGGILMTFLADVPGIFEIELEERGLRIAELEVS